MSARTIICLNCLVQSSIIYNITLSSLKRLKMNDDTSTFHLVNLFIANTIVCSKTFVLSAI